MFDYNCPYCGTEMLKLQTKKPDFTLEGLPKDEERLMEVVEFWDSGYSLHSDVLHVWQCEACAVKSGAKHSSFVMFKNGEIYGFKGTCWEKVKIAFKFR